MQLQVMPLEYAKESDENAFALNEFRLMPNSLCASYFVDTESDRKREQMSPAGNYLDTPPEREESRWNWQRT